MSKYDYDIVKTTWTKAGGATMQQMIVDMESLELPVDLRIKIGTEQVLIRETDEGFLLTPFHKQAGKPRGMLKGSGFTTERFFEQKRADKEMEA